MKNLIGKQFNRHKIESYLTKTSGSFYEAKLIKEIQSEYQLISIWESPDLGLCLLIDDQLMCAEADECYYHEALVYPALAHLYERHLLDSLKVLILGGGDGGSAEELLKCKFITQIDMVEIDQAVIDISREYLPEIHRNSFDKVEVVIQDGYDYIANYEGQYDAIFLDLNDPIGTNSVVRLYTKEFFQNLSSKFKHYAVMQIGCNEYNPYFRDCLKIIKDILPHSVLYGQYCPSYHCINYFVLLSHTPVAKTLTKDFFTTGDYDTAVLDSDYLNQIFTLPKNMQKLL